MDDALSINEVEEGVFEIGVHIADVTYFVEPNTRIDEEAKLRSSSLCLVSVFFYINREGEVLGDRKARV